MNAQSLVRQITASGSRLFPRERASETLVKEGFRIGDVSASMNLMACIAFLTRAVPGVPKHDVVCHFSRRESPFGDIAGYFPLKTKGAGYVVYVPGISKRLGERNRIPQMDGQGKPIGNYKDWPKASMEERLITIASHEVRHFLQDLIFRDKARRPRSSHLRSVMEYIALRFGEERRIWVREGKSPEFIERRTSQREFDAQVIETMVLISVHSGTTVRELIRLLRKRI